MNTLYTVENGKLVINPHPAQLEVIKLWLEEDYDKREYSEIPQQILLSAGTGGGKTSFGIYLTLKYLQKLVKEGRSNLDFIILAPDYKRLMNIINVKLRSLIERVFRMGKFHGHPEYVYELSGPYTGSRIYLYNASNPHSAEGIHADFAWIDEVGYDSSGIRVPLQTYRVIKDRLRLKRGKLFMTTTPYKINWVKPLIVDRSRQLVFKKEGDEIIREFSNISGDPRSLVIIFPSILNPTYSIEEFENASKEWDEQQYRMRFYGEWLSWGQKILYAFSSKNIIPKTAFDKKGDYIGYIGMDFGIDDPFACVWVVYDKKNQKWIVVDTYKVKTYDVLEIARDIITKTRSLQRELNFPTEIIYYADPTSGGRKIINKVDIENAFQRLNHSVVLRIPFSQVSTGLSIINRLFANEDMYIFDTCDDLIEEIENFIEYDPKHGQEHLTDALRYVVASEEQKFENMRMRTVKKEAEEKEENVSGELTIGQLIKFYERFNKSRGGVRIG